MNRDDLLAACFDAADPAAPKKWLSLTEADPDDGYRVHVRSVVGLDYRRVLVRNSVAPGAGITESDSTLHVAVLCHVCTDPDHRGRGYASALAASALEEAASHRTVAYAAAVAPGAEGFFERLGFVHPELAPAGFLVCALRPDEAEWPRGTVRLIGRGW